MCLLLAKGLKKNRWRKRKRKRRKSNHKLNKRDCLQQTSRYHVYPWIICPHPVIFVTNSCDESWDSSCEKSRVPVQKTTPQSEDRLCVTVY